MGVINAFAILVIIQVDLIASHVRILVLHAHQPHIVHSAKAQETGLFLAQITFVFAKMDTI